MHNELSQKQINIIINKCYGNISGITDLTAGSPPSFMFPFLINAFGYLLNNEPEKVLSKNGVKARKAVNILIKKIGKLFLNCPMVIENRNTLVNPSSKEKDNGIILPDKPVIWAPNHSFKDDILASILATYRHTYILLGSLPQIYNTFDGVTSWLNGSVVINRKVAASRKSAIPKALKAMELGADLLMFSEGVWNKTPNRLLLDLWPGIHRIAKETGALVVPVAHYIEDPTNQKKNNLIHTTIDDPIRIDDLSEKAGLEYLRDVIGTWYYLMMERYGKSTRTEETDGFTDSSNAWEKKLLDLVGTADRYDLEIELCADYRSKDIILPETVFYPIAGISRITPENAAHVAYANQLLTLRKSADYQRRF